jgi:hypothetical protein
MVAVLYGGHIVKYGTVRDIFGEGLLESKALTPWEL